MEIYIPSRSRYNKRPDTLNSIPLTCHHNVNIVVPKQEYNAYSYAFKDYKCKIIKCPVDGIGRVRQWIMENAKSNYVLFLDDDMKFGVRKEGIKMVNADFDDVANMFSLLKNWLDEGWLHVGISQRAGNNRVLSQYAETTRMNNAYAYNVKQFLKTGVRFDRLEVMEDFDVTLSLLKLGYNNRITYKYGWSQRKSGDIGGCSIYRTDAVQQQSAHKLKKLHPSLVKVIKKTSKQRWNGMDSSTRTDVRIQWKRAYKPKKSYGDLGILRYL